MLCSRIPCLKLETVLKKNGIEIKNIEFCNSLLNIATHIDGYINLPGCTVNLEYQTKCTQYGCQVTRSLANTEIIECITTHGAKPSGTIYPSARIVAKRHPDCYYEITLMPLSDGKRVYLSAWYCDLLQYDIILNVNGVFERYAVRFDPNTTIKVLV